MTIDSGFPPVEKLKSLEARTFKYISDCKVIEEEAGFSDFKKKATQYYSALSSKSKREQSPIDFQSYFNLEFEKRGLIFYIGVMIKNDYSQVTYYLAICSSVASGNCKILRKFHFDYDNGTGTRRQPHPRYHFQYAGEKPSGMCVPCEPYENVLYPSLSEPRLPYTPMSLALLLNCVFIEFRTEITNKISEDNQWRNLVEANEEQLLKPFYRNCCNLFNGEHSSKKLFTTDYCYGK